MSLNIWIAYLLAVLILSVSPGAGAVNTMSNSIRYGVRRTVPAILGLQAGLAANVLLVGAGLGALIASSAGAFTALKWAGVVYLVYLAWQKWTDRATFELSVAPGESAPVRRLFLQAALVNLTNPKAIVFMAALFPQFLDPARPQGLQFLVLGATLVAVDTLVMSGYAAFASVLRQVVRDRERMILQNRIFSFLFLGAGALLASVKA